MTHLPEPVAGRIGLLIGPGAERETMLQITATLALRGPVHVLDGGNSFNAFRLARHIRRQTSHVHETLDRIAIARAFTCYQVVTLFEQTPAVQGPQLALDLLATFCDESVSVSESERLLRITTGHLRRLRSRGPVMVSIRLPPQPERDGLVQIIREAADHLYIREMPATVIAAKLF